MILYLAYRTVSFAETSVDVLLGVFSTREKADKCIVRDRQGIEQTVVEMGAAAGGYHFRHRVRGETLDRGGDCSTS